MTATPKIPFRNREARNTSNSFYETSIIQKPRSYKNITPKRKAETNIPHEQRCKIFNKTLAN